MVVTVVFVVTVLLPSAPPHRGAQRRGGARGKTTTNRSVSALRCSRASTAGVRCWLQWRLPAAGGATGHTAALQHRACAATKARA